MPGSKGEWNRPRSPLFWVASGFAAWIALFTAGIIIDSAPYRKAVSPEGAEDLKAKEKVGPAFSLNGPKAKRDTLLLIRSSSAEDTSLAAFRIERLPPGFGPEEGEAGTTSKNEKGMLPALEATAGAFGSGLGEIFWTGWAFIVSVLCFTPSNLALLCCAAGVFGATGRRIKLSQQADPESLDQSFPLLSAVVRSLVVFLIVISGLLVLLENPIVGTASPGQYVRFGGLLSLTSFVVNYDPSMFAMLLEQVRSRLRERTDGSSEEGWDEDGDKA